MKMMSLVVVFLGMGTCSTKWWNNGKLCGCHDFWQENFRVSKILKTETFSKNHGCIACICLSSQYYPTKLGTKIVMLCCLSGSADIMKTVWMLQSISWTDISSVVSSALHRLGKIFL